MIKRGHRKKRLKVKRIKRGHRKKRLKVKRI